MPSSNQMTTSIIFGPSFYAGFKSPSPKISIPSPVHYLFVVFVVVQFSHQPVLRVKSETCAFKYFFDSPPSPPLEGAAQGTNNLWTARETHTNIKINSSEHLIFFKDLTPPRGNARGTNNLCKSGKTHIKHMKAQIKHKCTSFTSLTPHRERPRHE